MFGYVTMYVAQPALSGPKESQDNTIGKFSQKEFASNVQKFKLLTEEEQNYTLVEWKKSIYFDDFVTQCIQTLEPAERSNLVFFLAKSKQKDLVVLGIKSIKKLEYFPRIIFYCVVNQWKDLVDPYLEKIKGSEDFPHIITICAKHGWYEMVRSHITKIADPKLKNFVLEELLKIAKTEDVSSKIPSTVFKKQTERVVLEEAKTEEKNSAEQHSAEKKKKKKIPQSNIPLKRVKRIKRIISNIEVEVMGKSIFQILMMSQ